jgi:uncharacterized protein YegL
MKHGLTKIVFVVDRSGSMQSIATDMIGGFNQFIETQKEDKTGECIVSFIQFDDIVETVYKNVNVNNVQDLTDKTYSPRNCTALYDAVGKTIEDLAGDLEKLEEDQKPEKTWVVILTDGLENASVKYDQKKVRELITHYQQSYNWVFSYIGANQDSWATGGGIGINAANTLNYASTGDEKSISTGTVWKGLSDKASCLRSSTYGSLVNSVSFSDEEQKYQNDLINKKNKS